MVTNRLLGRPGSLVCRTGAAKRGCSAPGSGLLVGMWSGRRAENLTLEVTGSAVCPQHCQHDKLEQERQAERESDEDARPVDAVHPGLAHSTRINRLITQAANDRTHSSRKAFDAVVPDPLLGVAFTMW